MAHHLRLEEREVISEMLAQGASYRRIARALGRDRTTISREVHRNRCVGRYWASYAQHAAMRRRCQAREKSAKMNHPEIASYVQQKLRKWWSPEQISGRMRRDFPGISRLRISHQTIYDWIKQDGHRRPWQCYLRRFRLGRRRRRNQQQVSRSLKQRPDVINRRERYGDWEGDTIVGPRHVGPVLVTLVERRSGYLELAWAADAKSATVARSVASRLAKHPAQLRHSATFDNGSEFAQVSTLEQSLQISVFFADPGAPYQRGTNENTNGLIRQYFPKGTGFSSISRYKVAQAQDLLNHRPRKRLGYQTPHEVIAKERYRATQT
jgi:IS30 family transposase